MGKKQIPRSARNDNSRGYRRDVSPVEAGSGAGTIPHRSEDRPGPAERIRQPSEAGECAATGPVVGLGEVASGEWRVTSDN